MYLEEIQKLMRLIEESKLSRFRLKKGDFELVLEKESRHLPPPHHFAHYGEYPARSEKEGKVNEEKMSGSFIKAPMIGTYYNAPAPDQPPFVKVGDTVEEDQVICIIEAMKVMNEVKAGVKGKVKEIFCKNTQPVEFGTKLFRIE